ncbi:sigma 54-interacting transcriptional regulator [Neptunomonas phycophila]|uniref:sigma 54-interacting transcriptional regulator n=1 Tax=Neptunomonas phycophila TaxID=1572645 RepID=UPI0026E1E6D7|nr:sigma 54-interacting transcriptional regulator [Neptunomonas phycophila]MDO6466933.1 sigma 54-interacting transcriptional regulator [Neptunomonas phycophila]
MEFTIGCLSDPKDYANMETAIANYTHADDSFMVTKNLSCRHPGVVIAKTKDQLQHFQAEVLNLTTATPFVPRFLAIKPELLASITQEHLTTFSDILPCDSFKELCQKIVCRLQRTHAVKQCINQSKYSYFVHGISDAWQKTLFELTEAALFSSSPILITGANGTGKELAAQWINDVSLQVPPPSSSSTSTSAKTLTTVDCTGLSKELMGSELFGHAKGAFTGAHYNREGALDLANNGTLFLDEIGEMDTPLQAGLLRVLQEGTYKPVGSNTWKRSNFRLISATNRNLFEQQKTGQFRQDLYYRLSGWECKLPSLQERLADIVPLARLFIENATKKKITLDSCVESFLLTREYPGNIRELKHLCERIANRFVGGERITLADIPCSDLKDFFNPEHNQLLQLDNLVEMAVFSGINLKALQQRVNDTAKAVAIKHYDGNLKAAAKILGVHERTLQLHKARSKSDMASNNAC